jgi:hypothetical protein
MVTDCARSQPAESAERQRNDAAGASGLLIRSHVQVASSSKRMVTGGGGCSQLGVQL